MFLVFMPLLHSAVKHVPVVMFMVRCGRHSVAKSSQMIDSGSGVSESGVVNHRLRISEQGDRLERHARYSHSVLACGREGTLLAAVSRCTRTARSRAGRRAPRFRPALRCTCCGRGRGSCACFRAPGVPARRRRRSRVPPARMNRCRRETIIRPAWSRWWRRIRLADRLAGRPGGRALSAAAGATTFLSRGRQGGAAGEPEFPPTARGARTRT